MHESSIRCTRKNCLIQNILWKKGHGRQKSIPSLGTPAPTARGYYLNSVKKCKHSSKYVPQMVSTAICIEYRGSLLFYRFWDFENHMLHKIHIFQIISIFSTKPSSHTYASKREKSPKWKPF